MNVLSQLKSSSKANGKNRWSADEEVLFFTLKYIDNKGPTEIEETIGRSKLGFYAKTASIMKRLEQADLAEDHTLEDIIEVIRSTNKS